MNQMINSFIAGLNEVGRGFWSYSTVVFVQSSLLVVFLLVVNFLIRNRVRAVFRYSMWMLVFIKLMLPGSFAMPTGVGYWIGDYFADTESVEASVAEVSPVTINISQEVVPLKVPVVREVAPAGVNLEPICWEGMVFLAWLAGVVVFLALLIQRVYFIRGLVAQSKPANGRLVEVLQRCRKQVGVSCNVELRLTGDTLSPAVCGLFKPVILMPATMLERLSRDKVRAVLVHELTHVKRGDIWVNLLQSMLQIVYFYNPFVWVANAIVRRTREQAVDEAVVVVFGGETKSYSNVLIDIAEMVFCKPGFGLRLVGVVESKKALEGRINNMLNRKGLKSSKLGFVGLAVIIVIGIVVLPMASGAADGKRKLPSYVPSTSTLNEKGHIVDKVDYPFVNDPQVLGGWKTVDFVREIDDFEPGDVSWGGKLFLNHLIFEEGGKMGGGILKWTKGLVLYDNDVITASKYEIRKIDGNEYMFYEWKSGDYTFRHSKPAYYVLKRERTKNLKHQPRVGKKASIPETSIINEQGRIVDKLDYPFVDHPELVGTWASVDFVKEMEDFKVGEKQWRGGKLYLKELIFLPGGRTFKPWWTWTKGLVFHSGDKTASRYVIKKMNGSTYMFFEWKSGDYTIRHMKPKYYVLKKVSSETGGIAENWASQPSDAKFTRRLQRRVKRLDIDSAELKDVWKIFGKPAQYLWGSESFSEDDLPERYIMIYPAGFSIFMFNDQIRELRFRQSGYVFNGAIQVGSTLDEVVANIGEPEEIVTNKKLKFKKDVLYKDIDGEKGYCYYRPSGKSVRMFFKDYKVAALFVTRTEEQ